MGVRNMGIFDSWMCSNRECINSKTYSKEGICPVCGSEIQKFGFFEFSKLAKVKGDYKRKQKKQMAARKQKNKVSENNFNKGYNCYLKGKYEKAIFYLDQIKQNDPNYKVGQFHMANCFFELGKFEDALNCYNIVISVKDIHEYVNSDLKESIREEKEKEINELELSKEEKLSIIESDNNPFKDVAMKKILLINKQIGSKKEISKIESEIKKERIEREKALKVELNKNYVYIEKFAYRYGENYTDDDLKKLTSLLAHNGHLITRENYTHLKSLINKEIIEIKYDNFKANLNYVEDDHNPEKNPMINGKDTKTLQKYVERLLDLYGTNYINHVNQFIRFLEENGIEYNSRKFYQIVEEVTTNKEISNYENELLSADELENSPFFEINDIDSLNGYEFELFLKILFEKMGYDVYNTPLSGDQGADLIIKRFGESIAVQAKRYSDKVSNKAVQESVASIAHYNANKGMVITNNEFTPSAIELADSNNIILVDRNKLGELLKKHQIRKNEVHD
jgi:hypothetical protein